MRLPTNALVLIGPAILAVFAACFLVAWLANRKQKHILYFFVAIALFCLGSLSQMLWIPAGSAPNATTSAFIYTLSVLLICDGLLKRDHQKIPISGYLVTMSVIVGSIAYFSFVYSNLAIRIYVLNFGFGTIFLCLLWKIRYMRTGATAEKALFWILLVFSLQFFIRTIVTMESLPLTPSEFGLSIFWYSLQFSLAVLGVAFALSLLGVVVADKYKDLDYERLVDPLTGLLNRRGLAESINGIYQSEPPVISMMIIDIDHFKSINDAYGHAAGDRVILTVANTIATTAAKYKAICCRVGGEEYAVLLPLIDLDDALELADLIRENVSSLNIFNDGGSSGVTVSIGVTAAYSEFSLEQLMSEADLALYKAKRSGRNRVKFYTQGNQLTGSRKLSRQMA